MPFALIAFVILMLLEIQQASLTNLSTVQVFTRDNCVNHVVPERRLTRLFSDVMVDLLVVMEAWHVFCPFSFPKFDVAQDSMS